MQISKFRIPQLYCLKFSFNLANISSRNVKLALQPDTSKQCKTTNTSYYGVSRDVPDSHSFRWYSILQRAGSG